MIQSVDLKNIYLKAFYTTFSFMVYSIELNLHNAIFNIF